MAGLDKQFGSSSDFTSVDATGGLTSVATVEVAVTERCPANLDAGYDLI